MIHFSETSFHTEGVHPQFLPQVTVPEGSWRMGSDVEGRGDRGATEPCCAREAQRQVVVQSVARVEVSLSTPQSSTWLAAVPALGTEVAQRWVGTKGGLGFALCGRLMHHYDGGIPEVESCALGNCGIRSSDDGEKAGHACIFRGGASAHVARDTGVPGGPRLAPLS